MKRSVLSIIVAILVLIGAVLCCREFWSPEEAPEVTNPLTVAGDDAKEDGENTKREDSMKVYDNGLAKFTYDSSKTVFVEMPSDNEEGYPMTSFLLIDNEDVLPRLDIIPLELTESFSDDVTVEHWQELAKALMMAYYNSVEQENVNINFSDGVVKINEGEAKMYVYVATSLEGSSTPDMNGVIRLTANKDSAIVTLALTRKGEVIPKDIEDIFMSVKLES